MTPDQRALARLDRGTVISPVTPVREPSGTE